MGIYRQNIYYRACLWCGLRTLQRIFLHGQLWLKTFLRFELNFYWILIPVKILLPLKSKYIKTQLGTWRQCMQVEVWKYCPLYPVCPVSATIKLIAAVQCLPCLLSPLLGWGVLSELGQVLACPLHYRVRELSTKFCESFHKILRRPLLDLSSCL